VKILGIETSKQEVLSLREFLPGSAAAELLAKVLFKMEQEGLSGLRNVGHGIEAVRYHQGWLDALSRFEGMTRALLGVDLEKPDVDEDAEVEINEEVTDVAY
jgi:hypothetical protein